MITRYIMVLCDHDVPGEICGEESDACMTEVEARRDARKAGWKVGWNRDQPDYCPKHRELH